MHRFANCRVAVFLTVLVASADVPAQPPGRGGGMPVEVATIIERDVPPSLRLVGTINPDRRAVIASEVEGLVAEFKTDEGTFVEPGDVICRLNNTVAQLAYDEALATFEGLQQQLAQMLNGERKEDLDRWAALVTEAEAMAKKWEYERTRTRDLVSRGQGSDKEAHDAEMEFLAAQSRFEQARAQLERARNGARTEEVARMRAQVAAQQAVVKRAARDLNRTEIRAPFAGAIVAKRTEVGAWVAVGAPVCELIALDTVRIRTDVPESAVGHAVVGARATIEIEALGRSVSGTISRVVPQADAAARTFPVEIDVPNKDHTLLAGMFVWAYVPAGPTGKRLMLTKDAVVARGLSKTIYVVRPTGEDAFTAFPTAVATGLELGGEVEVAAPGLKAGDMVVSRANERLMDFPMPVTPIRSDRGSPTTRPAAPPQTQPTSP